MSRVSPRQAAERSSPSGDRGWRAVLGRRLLRPLARRLLRWSERLLPSSAQSQAVSPGALPEPTDVLRSSAGGPPEHWLEHIRQRRPELLPGLLSSAGGESEEWGEPQILQEPQALQEDLALPGPPSEMPGPNETRGPSETSAGVASGTEPRPDPVFPPQKHPSRAVGPSFAASVDRSRGRRAVGIGAEGSPRIRHEVPKVNYPATSRSPAGRRPGLRPAEGQSLVSPLAEGNDGAAAARFAGYPGRPQVPGTTSEESSPQVPGTYSENIGKTLQQVPGTYPEVSESRRPQVPGTHGEPSYGEPTDEVVPQVPGTFEEGSVQVPAVQVPGTVQGSTVQSNAGAEHWAPRVTAPRRTFGAIHGSYATAERPSVRPNPFASLLADGAAERPATSWPSVTPEPWPSLPPSEVTLDATLAIRATLWPADELRRQKEQRGEPWKHRTHHILG